ncbi:MAG TPA: hypothetical protein VGO57_07880 [Verrucomicrobiae bacterium]|jgi:hypothetical protein
MKQICLIAIFLLAPILTPGFLFAQSDYVIIDQTANSRSWQKTSYETNAAGEVMTHVHKYTELATGLNHLVDGQWVSSKEEIIILPDGRAAATNGQHQAYLPSDIYNGIIETVTPDGQHLKSQPAALGYDDGKNTILIAVLTNSVGYLANSNQIIYPNAFAGLAADLRYTYTRSGFEQDVVLREQPPTPDSLGLDTQNTRLQVLTEFFENPKPEEIKTAVKNKDGLIDTTLKFGTMELARGKAFVPDDGTKNGMRNKGIAVYKSWLSLKNRHFLIEEMPISALSAQLEKLPTQTTAAPKTTSSELAKASAKRLLPPIHSIQHHNEAFQLAKADFNLKPAVVIDYNSIASRQTNFTFQPNATYLVSGGYYLDGTTTINAGTVIKSGEATGLFLTGSLSCPTNSYNPAIFTDQNDDSDGEIIAGSSGVPTIQQYTEDLSLGNWFGSVTNYLVKNLHFRYSEIGLMAGSTASIDIWNCQFSHCEQGLDDGQYYASDLRLHNVLFDDCDQALNFESGVGYSITGEQVTLDATNIWTPDRFGNTPYGVYFTNSIFNGNVQSSSSTHFYTNRVVMNPPGTVFQTAGEGDHYLAVNSAYRNIGTTLISSNLLVQLRQKTTYPPENLPGDFSSTTTLYPHVARDTDVPDLGYHYDPIDYQGSSLSVEPGATLTLTNGAVVGVAGNSLMVGGILVFNQQMTNAEVQEAQTAPLGILIGSNASAAFADADGNGLPDWWEEMYFGRTGLNPNASYDDQGNTLLYDYQNGLMPNVINFSIQSTNNYVNQAEAPVQLILASGSPSYLAVSIDDTNYTVDAAWSTYTSSNIDVNLGTTQGWHEVWIGLRSEADAASAAVWQRKRLKLDLTSPLLVITNPNVSTVSVPEIQLQGFSPEELSHLSYDLTNAAGVETNQDVGITSQIYSTNTYEFTTNYFECVDVPLTNGLNVITLHAIDMAGNVTTTNFSFTFDSSSRTNPPAIKLYWPQNGTLVCNSNYTWRGWVDDPTATVTAQFIDTNGITNVFSGIVERDGKFWVENLPLSDNTNFLTLTVTDSSGNVAVTNIAVFPSVVGLTINSPSSDNLWNKYINVTGTVSDTNNYTVWVNGIKATFNDNGTWLAMNVYLPIGGTALIQARAISNSDHGGNGTGGSGGGPAAYNNLGNPTPSSDDDAELQVDKPAEIKEISDYYDLSFEGEVTRDVNVFWAPDAPYDIYTSWTASPDWENTDQSCPAFPECFYDGLYDSGIITLTGPGGTSTSTPDDATPWQAMSEHSEMVTPWPPDLGVYHRTAQSTFILLTGGKGKSGRKNLFQISASALNIPDLVSQGLITTVPSQSIKVMGKPLGAGGYIYVILPDNTSCDVTPQVDGVDYYNFTVGQQKYTSQLEIFVDQPYPDLSLYANVSPEDLPLGYPFWRLGVNAGHAWWKLDSGAPLEAINQFAKNYASQWVNQEVGYGPNPDVDWKDWVLGLVTGTPPSEPGELPWPNDHTPTVHKTYAIDFFAPGLVESLNLTEYVHENPGTFILVSSTCVTKTREAGGAAGITMPSDSFPEDLGFDLPPENP